LSCLILIRSQIFLFCADKIHASKQELLRDLIGWCEYAVHPTRSGDIFNLRHWLTTLIPTRLPSGQRIEKMTFFRHVSPTFPALEPQQTREHADKTTFILYRSFIPYESI